MHQTLGEYKVCGFHRIGIQGIGEKPLETNSDELFPWFSLRRRKIGAGLADLMTYINRIHQMHVMAIYLRLIG